MVIFLLAGESYVRGTEQINLLELGIRSKIDELATAFLAEGFFFVRIGASYVFTWRNKKQFNPSPRNELHNIFILQNLQPNAELGLGNNMLFYYCDRCLSAGNNEFPAIESRSLYRQISLHGQISLCQDKSELFHVDDVTKT